VYHRLVLVVKEVKLTVDTCTEVGPEWAASRRVSIEVPGSDIDAERMITLFHDLMLGLGYHPYSVADAMIEKGEEYRGSFPADS
jgi:hypothetical protein